MLDHIVGWLLPPNDSSHIFTCIDKFSCWSVAASPKCILASVINIDGGAALESSLLRKLTRLIRISKIHKTTYRTISNEIVERLDRQFQVTLTTVLTVKNSSVTLVIRSRKKKDIGCYTAELVYGATYRLLRELFSSSKHVPNDLTKYSLL